MTGASGLSGLSDLPGFEIDSRNRLFAYQVLSSALAAAESYTFLSGGRHIQNSGIEHFVSAEVAKALLVYKARIWTQFDISSNKFKNDGMIHTIDHAILEATGYIAFGDEKERKRLDLGLLCDFGTRFKLPRREPHEMIYALDVKRSLHDSDLDAVRVCELLDLHRDEGWCCFGGAILGFVAGNENTKKPLNDVISARLASMRAKIESITKRRPKDLSCAYMTRANPLTQFENDFVKYNTQQFRTLTACMIAMKFQN